MTETFHVTSVEKENIKMHLNWSAIVKSKYP